MAAPLLHPTCQKQTAKDETHKDETYTYTHSPGTVQRQPTVLLHTLCFVQLGTTPAMVRECQEREHSGVRY